MTEFKIDPIDLTARLVRIQSVNPPGNEAVCAEMLADILAPAGFELTRQEYALGRPNLIARLPGQGGPPLALTGHLDVVPPGGAPWSFEPFSGQIKDGNLLGRGSSDMKSGVAAITAAAVELAALAKQNKGCRGGLTLVYTVDEELGCAGSRGMLEQKGLLEAAGALIVAEPTGLKLGLGHKGGVWLTVRAEGKSAHGSMPEKGENAIYKLARAALALENFAYSAPAHPNLGRATVSVGTIKGGVAANLVPDLAEMAVDTRLVPGQRVDQALAEIQAAMGSRVEIVNHHGAAGVWTEAQVPFVQKAAQITAEVLGREEEPIGLSYCTDGANLKPAMGNPPTIILGPGLAEQCHQTDEYCPVELITQATEIYYRLGQDWLGLGNI